MQAVRRFRAICEWAIGRPARSFTLFRDMMGVGPVARATERLFFLGRSGFALLALASDVVTPFGAAEQIVEAKVSGVVIAVLVQLAIAVPTYLARRLDGVPPTTMPDAPVIPADADADGPNLATAGMPRPQEYERQGVIPGPGDIRIPNPNLSPRWPS